jgi:hypothetical protein
MNFWQRLLITVLAMLLVGFVAGQIWLSLFSLPMPSFLAGMVGGLTALPLWEALKRLNRLG